MAFSSPIISFNEHMKTLWVKTNHGSSSATKPGAKRSSIACPTLSTLLEQNPNLHLLAPLSVAVPPVASWKICKNLQIFLHSPNVNTYSACLLEPWDREMKSNSPEFSSWAVPKKPMRGPPLQVSNFRFPAHLPTPNTAGLPKTEAWDGEGRDNLQLSFSWTFSWRGS